MKFRSGFVSNSSSSSFTVNKNIPGIYLEVVLNPEKYVKNVEKIYRKNNNIDDSIEIEAFQYVEDCKMWNVSERRDSVVFTTGMDNFLWEDYYDIVLSLDEIEILKVRLS